MDMTQMKTATQHQTSVVWDGTWLSLRHKKPPRWFNCRQFYKGMRPKMCTQSWTLRKFWLTLKINSDSSEGQYCGVNLDFDYHCHDSAFVRITREAIQDLSEFQYVIVVWVRPKLTLKWISFCLYQEGRHSRRARNKSPVFVQNKNRAKQDLD